MTADIIAKYLPWIMSCVTIVAIDLQGRKWPRAWALSLAGQVLWFTWIAATWDSVGKGFLPMTLVLSFQYAWNHLRWSREARGAQQSFKCCRGCRSPIRCTDAQGCFHQAIESDGAQEGQKRAQERRSPAPQGIEPSKPWPRF